MSIPHKCPVCEGRGEVGKRLAQVGAVLISAKPQRFRCHGCQATGIVWDTTFNLNPIQPWTTGEIPMIGGGGITYTNGGPAPQHLQTEWREGIVEINDGVSKCRDCSVPYHMEAPRSCRNFKQHGTTKNPRPCEDCTGPLDKEPNLGCQLPGEHSRASERDPSWTGGYDCACTPDGEPHSDACKGV